MTDHTARPESWDEITRWAARNHPSDDCLMELRARVERLEQRTQDELANWRTAAVTQGLIDRRLDRLEHRLERLEGQQQPAPSTPAGQGELVNSVAKVIVNVGLTSFSADLRPEARAAIRVVADWLEHQGEDIIAVLLRMEVGR
jgi:hypothetical protein